MVTALLGLLLLPRRLCAAEASVSGLVSVVIIIQLEEGGGLLLWIGGGSTRSPCLDTGPVHNVRILLVVRRLAGICTHSS